MVDTSVLIGGDALPGNMDVSVASVTFAELSFGVRAAREPVEQAVRQARLDRLLTELGPGLPFDDRAATAFGTITALVLAAGRNPRSRAVDLMIAATAYANGAGVLTHNVVDFAPLEPLMPVMGV